VKWNASISRWLVAFVVMGVVSACASAPPPNASGMAAKDVDPAKPGGVAGIGIEAQDIVAMTDKMMRDMLGNATLAGRAKPPRVVIDSQYFKNEGTEPINRDLITNRLRVELNRAANGRMTFVTRAALTAVESAREEKRQGLTDQGTTGLTRAMMGIDYRLTGTIATLDSKNPKSGVMQRYNQITFEMLDLESGEIVWSGLYEIERQAADDIVYR
jgi:PBP1b-binding outer membrane lipoprotein LpoB